MTVVHIVAVYGLILPSNTFNMTYYTILCNITLTLSLAHLYRSKVSQRHQSEPFSSHSLKQDGHIYIQHIMKTMIYKGEYVRSYVWAVLGQWATPKVCLRWLNPCRVWSPTRSAG